jgi:5-methylcytosine-specific restriction endonuclease McrA
VSRIAPATLEPVDLDDRGSMTPARKHRIWLSRDGKCWMCGFEVPETGPGVRYDHKLALELGGADDDANLWPLHREPCDRLKTAADLRRIAKMRRQEKLRADVPSTRSASWGNKARPMQRAPRTQKRGRNG